VTVVLDRVGASRHYQGALPPVTVVDGRGTLVGWTATLTYPANGQRGDVLAVRPTTPSVIDGEPRAIVAARRFLLSPGDSHALFRAPSGGGGGTYAAGATVDLVAEDGAASTRQIELAITVH
jgi:hypothetical protein